MRSWQPLAQGLEGYFRDPGIDWNTVRDSEKRNIFWRDTGFDHFQEAELTKFLARDAVLRKENVLFGIEMTLEVRDAGLSLKKWAGMRDQDPPSRPC